MKTADRSRLAFPLQWPEAWPRTVPGRRQPNVRFKVTFAIARNELIDGLRILGAKDVVVSSNVALRHDGLPYADGDHGSLVMQDPGVAVYWVRKDQPFAIACDRWTKVRHNIRSVGLAVEGLRAIERSGSSRLLDRAFQGFAALPSGIVTPAPVSWRAMLGFAEGQQLRLEDVRRTYESLAMRHHPDRGGSHERMVEINRAWEQAQQELG